MSEKKFVVGQEVIVTRPLYRGGHDRVVISTVGRVFVYVGEDFDTRKFRIDDGSEQMNGYPGGTLYTLAEWDEKKKFTDVVAQLRALGVSFEYGSARKFSLAQLEAALLALGGEG